MPPDANPYVGPRPFEADDADVFFGRKREVEDLLALVVAHQVVLLYASSGAGKSSLLNAALLPRLVEEEEFEVLPVARVRGLLVDVPEEANAFVAGVLSHLSSEPGETSLRAFLASRARPVLADGFEAPRALVIDQLEELFTSWPERWAERGVLFEQLKGALADDPMLRVVLSVREDFLAQLDPYVRVLPDDVVRYRLERLGYAAALGAATGPAQRGGRTFAPGVAEQLVDDLLEVRVDTGRGPVPVRGEFVEPVQLQVACRRLWEALPADASEITEEHRVQFGNVDEVLSDFYDEAISAAAAAGHLREPVLRERFAKAFVTPMGTRGTVLWTQEDTAKIPTAAIEELDARHLIRAELRAGARWYELTHDRLIEPIRASNREAESRRRRRNLRRAAALVALAAVAAVATIVGLISTTSESQSAETAQASTIEELRRQVRAAEAANKALLALLNAPSPINSSSFGQDGSSIVTVDDSGVARIWNVGGRGGRVIGRTRPKVTAAVFDGRGGVVLGRNDGTVERVDIATRGSVAIRLEPPSRVVGLAARPGGGAAIASDDGRILVWSGEPDEPAELLDRLEAPPASSLAFSSDGLFAAADALGVVRVWDLKRRAPLRSFGKKRRDSSTASAFTPDGAGVLVVRSDGTIELRATRKSRTTRLAKLSPASAAIAAVSAGGSTIALFGADGGRVLDAEGTVVARLSTAGDTLLAAAVSADGSTIAAVTGEGDVLVWRPLPDLAVDARVAGGTVNARVANAGLRNSPATVVRVRRASGPIDRPVPPLAPGQSTTVRIRSSASVESVEVDPDRTMRERSYANNRDELQPPPTDVGVSPAEAVRESIVEAALTAVRKQAQIEYSPTAQRMQGVREKIRLPNVPRYEDTSSFVTWCYWQSGAPDPNGRRYDGFGVTGTLIVQGKPTQNPKPGDLVFYGRSVDQPLAVGIYAGNGRVVIHTNEDRSPMNRPVRFRDDFPLLGYRTYRLTR